MSFTDWSMVAVGVAGLSFFAIGIGYAIARRSRL